MAAPCRSAARLLPDRQTPKLSTRGVEAHGRDPTLYPARAAGIRIKLRLLSRRPFYAKRLERFALVNAVVSFIVNPSGY